MATYHIHLNGIVQGVGFRPAVYHLATEMDLKGYVENGSDGVNVFINATKSEANLFFEKLRLHAPERSKISSASIQKIPHQLFSAFSIALSKDAASEKQVSIPPDLATCANCLADLHDVNNRRHRYPFITCTQCGPRYSIINSLPYERHYTSMSRFEPCKTCGHEYNSLTDRRFFSQSNSCTQCGISLILQKDASSVMLTNVGDILSKVKILLKQGKIIAVKGIGGYILLCDAQQNATIKLLRSRKHRPSKPFAILYPDIKTIQNYFEVSDNEKMFLTSVEAPIVLLHPKRLARRSLAINHIAPGLNRLGVMIPYNPLFDLIARDYGKPLIATSANISGSPIIYRDDDALNYLFDIADYIVSHNRAILVPQDDSVVQVSSLTNLPVILRRSRGYAPSFLQYQARADQSILATGAFIKSSFTLALKGNVFVSQFLGSGESFESQLMYRHTLEHWLNMYTVKPDLIIADKHPDYFSHQYAHDLARKFSVKLKLVQHHEAHFAAILGEHHHLLSTPKRTMGVIWDGTGLGHDGHIWGGEFFTYQNGQMRRCAHFDYFPSIAGDKTALEPRIAALCASHLVCPPSRQLKEKFTVTEWNNYQALINNSKLHTSSVGRLFDAAASLLGICDKQTYEGEAALYLQKLAEDYVAARGYCNCKSYFEGKPEGDGVPTGALIEGMIKDLQGGKDKGYIAARFHYSLVCLVDAMALRFKVTDICFSGGVFQNTLLVDWIRSKYTGKYQLYFHINLCPNDENISFGQMVYAENNITSAEGGIHQPNFNQTDHALCAAEELIN
ncbi:carbamoyltransferase HypF [Mucilaginibacter paludis]|uniref:Carbamoyltransferase n=1 Tax=Mucilaginibacter paludis DSM 18603 TaxID=714943 RepID=H1Y5G5_9SPHI|nr:carbamoyltransferase HypF [Mucilaginibacter paludis]EHQ29317.1 (NiFe) hydrogenase maturation protein HypF [Mucilaginibacter paludis DSM 18603]